MKERNRKGNGEERGKKSEGKKAKGSEGKKKRIKIYK